MAKTLTEILVSKLHHHIQILNYCILQAINITILLYDFIICEFGLCDLFNHIIKYAEALLCSYIVYCFLSKVKWIHPLWFHGTYLSCVTRSICSMNTTKFPQLQVLSLFLNYCSYLTNSTCVQLHTAYNSNSTHQLRGNGLPFSTNLV